VPHALAPPFIKETIVDNQQDPAVAVITGGASGIGLKTCHLFAERGYAVAVADLNAAGAKQVADDISANGGSAQAFELDLEQFASITALRESVVAQMGVPSVVANVAGWDLPAPFLSDTPEYQRKVIEVNLLGPIRVSHEFLTAMSEAGKGGRVINVSSDAGRVGSSGEVVYSAAKGGIIALTKGLAREMARYQITVNCVCPGPTDTPMFKRASDSLQAALIKGIPLRRLAQPEEIASAIAFFASDEAAYITGQVLSVSGGLTMVD
jgi:2-hydroxycyclohexanecarboxyl-CoA dehydrogenase